MPGVGLPGNASKRVFRGSIREVKTRMRNPERPAAVAIALVCAALVAASEPTQCAASWPRNGPEERDGGTDG